MNLNEDFDDEPLRGKIRPKTDDEQPTFIVHLKGECGECMDCGRKLPTSIKGPLIGEILGFDNEAFYIPDERDTNPTCGENARLYRLAKRSGY